MFRISNSWQTNFGLIFALLSFWALMKFLRSDRKFGYYLLSLLFFWGGVEFVFVRSHSLIAPILILELLFLLHSFKLTSIPWLLIRQAPFWLIFNDRYLSATVGGLGLGGVINSLLHGEVEVLTAFFANIGNTLIQTVWQFKFIEVNFPKEQFILLLIFLILSWILLSIFAAGLRIKFSAMVFLMGAYFLNKLFIGKNLFWYRSDADFIAGALGMYLPILLIALGMALKKINENLQLALYFGLAMLFSQIFGYFIQYQDAIFTTTHRYLTYSFVGYSLIVGGIIFALYNKILTICLNQKNHTFALRKYAHILAVFPLILVLGNNLYLGVRYQKEVVVNISQPTRKFYQDLKNFVPRVSKGDVFYFDIEDNSFYKSQFGNFFSVGSMPDSTALAIYYGVDRYDISLISDFNELLYKLSKDEVSLDNIHSFYYGSSGLINTSASLKTLLQSGFSPQIMNSEKQDDATVLLSTNNLIASPLSPVLLTIEAKIVPNVDSINSLYFGTVKDETFTSEQKIKMISYLLSRQDYYKNVKPSSLSQWKFQEIANITDNELNTSWRSHRIYWHENRHEEFIVDLGSLNKINSVIWTNWRHVHTPTSYTINVSIDGQVWKTVKRVENGLEKKDGESVRDYFNDEIARFVKMSITQTFSGEEPALVEFEVVESEYRDIDIKQAFAFIDNPANYISRKEEWGQIVPRMASLLNLKTTWETNKGKGEKKVPINTFDSVNKYEFIIDAGGTTMKRIILSVPNIPIRIDIRSSTLQNLSLDDIKSRKLIKEVVEN